VSGSAHVQAEVDRLARELGQSVLVEDHRQVPVWWSTLGAVDGTRMRTILDRRVEPEAAAVLERFQIASATEPVRTPAMPKIDMWARWCMPARHEGRLYGYLWVLDPDGSVGKAELGQVVECAALAASVLAGTKQSSEQIDRVRAELLARLVRGPDDQALRELVRIEHVPHDAMVQVNAPARRGGWGLPDGMSVHVITRRAREASSGAPVPLIELSEAVRRATATRRVLAAGAQLALPTWNHLGAWRLVVEAPDSLRPGDLHAGAEKLVALDRVDLVESARAMVDLGGDAAAAAQALHIHRTTLYYRVGRIKELTGINLFDGAERTHLQPALWLSAYRAL
jgi:hypothetical protein